MAILPPSSNPNEIPIIFTTTGAEKAVSDADRVGAALIGVSNKFQAVERASKASATVFESVQRKMFSNIRAGGRAITTGLIANLATGNGMMSSWDQIKSLMNPQVFGMGVGEHFAGTTVDKLTRGMRNKGFAMGLARTGLAVGARFGGALAGAAAGSVVPGIGTAIGAGVGTVAETVAGPVYRGIRKMFDPSWGERYTSQDQDLMARGNQLSLSSYLKYGAYNTRKFRDASFWPETDSFSPNQLATPDGYDPEKDIFQDRDVIIKDRLQTLQGPSVSSALRLINRARERQINTSGNVQF